MTQLACHDSQRRIIELVLTRPFSPSQFWLYSHLFSEKKEEKVISDTGLGEKKKNMTREFQFT